MIQIKLSVIFILAAAAIAPVFALPLPGSEGASSPKGQKVDSHGSTGPSQSTASGTVASSQPGKDATSLTQGQIAGGVSSTHSNLLGKRPRESESGSSSDSGSEPGTTKRMTGGPPLRVGPEPKGKTETSKPDPKRRKGPMGLKIETQDLPKASSSTIHKDSPASAMSTPDAPVDSMPMPVDLMPAASTHHDQHTGAPQAPSPKGKR